MAFYSDLFDYSKNFKSKDEIVESIKSSEFYKNDELASAEVINFFSTSKQRSYLVFTRETVYCVVDDTRKKEVFVSWMEKRENFDEMEFRKVTEEKKFGKLNFGDKYQDWLYSPDILKSANSSDLEISAVLKKLKSEIQ